MSTFDHNLVSPAAFEARYQAREDPWNYQSSPYERAKYEITLASLSRLRYDQAFEPACSIGELSVMLASRCDRLLAIDVSKTAVDIARRRCAGLPNVRVECRDLRDAIEETPSEAWKDRPRHLFGEFDLIVFSEVGYYFDVATLGSLVRRLAESLRPNGEFMAVHWRGHSADHVLHGDEVHRTLFESLPLHHRLGDRHPGFQIDSWIKP